MGLFEDSGINWENPQNNIEFGYAFACLKAAVDERTDPWLGGTNDDPVVTLDNIKNDNPYPYLYSSYIPYAANNRNRIRTIITSIFSAATSSVVELSPQEVLQDTSEYMKIVYGNNYEDKRRSILSPGIKTFLQVYEQSERSYNANNVLKNYYYNTVTSLSTDERWEKLSTVIGEDLSPLEEIVRNEYYPNNLLLSTEVLRLAYKVLSFCNVRSLTVSVDEPANDSAKRKFGRSYDINLNNYQVITSTLDPTYNSAYSDALSEFDSSDLAPSQGGKNIYSSYSRRQALSAPYNTGVYTVSLYDSPDYLRAEMRDLGDINIRSVAYMNVMDHFFENTVRYDEPFTRSSKGVYDNYGRGWEENKVTDIIVPYSTINNVYEYYPGAVASAPSKTIIPPSHYSDSITETSRGFDITRKAIVNTNLPDKTKWYQTPHQNSYLHTSVQ